MGAPRCPSTREDQRTWPAAWPPHKNACHAAGGELASPCTNKSRARRNIAHAIAASPPADVRLDGVLAYGERSGARGRGYFMMDSPGNDLESIAGQVR